MEQNPEKRGTDLFALVSAHRRCIMGVAALLIYIFHKHSLIFRSGFLATLESCGRKILFLGVDVFMLLSGLGLTYAIRKQKLFPFWLKRLKRIALPFLVTGASSPSWSNGTRQPCSATFPAGIFTRRTCTAFYGSSPRS